MQPSDIILDKPLFLALGSYILGKESESILYPKDRLPLSAKSWQWKKTKSSKVLMAEGLMEALGD